MVEFRDVDVVKVANVYYGGKVVSRTLNFPDGTRKTLGFMQPGEYEFSTEQAEFIEVLGGAAEVQIEGRHGWTHCATGSEFHVPENASFKLKVDAYFDYCCSYL
ncbi:MAG: pyrimidine/purine nucleoside phosphorylase [Pseudomonadales bacterium]